MPKSKIEFLWDLVGVFKEDKAKKADPDAMFVRDAKVSNNYGVVRFIGAGVKTKRISIGDLVYFGNKIEPVQIGGEEILVMEARNVIGIDKE